jgi:hypothetical protein
VCAPVFVLALLRRVAVAEEVAPPQPTAKGTPGGTYTVTVTATAGTLSHQAGLTVIVQYVWHGLSFFYDGYTRRIRKPIQSTNRFASLRRAISEETPVRLPGLLP